MKTNLPQKISRKRKGATAMEVIMIVTIGACLIGGIYAFYKKSGGDTNTKYDNNVGNATTINFTGGDNNGDQGDKKP